jgi:hypothetical protein
MLNREGERRSQLNESFTSLKKPLRLIVIGSNAQLLPPPISDAFDNVTGPFPVRSGGACAPSLTSSGPFNLFRHPSARRLITHLISLITIEDLGKQPWKTLHRFLPQKRGSSVLGCCKMLVN